MPTTKLILTILNAEPYINIGLKIIQTKVTNKQIGNKLLGKLTKPPTSIETWINIFSFLETEDWDKIFLRTFKITKETYLQSFQYNILKRILNCNDKLYKWKIKPNNKCDVCREVDSIEHHLFYCKISTKVWNQLKDWMVGGLGFGIGLTVARLCLEFLSIIILTSKLLTF